MTDPSIQSIADAVLNEGMAIIPDAFAPEFGERLQSLTAELAREHAAPAKSPQYRDNAGNLSMRLYNVFSRHPLYREAASHELINAVLLRLLGPGYLLFATAVNEVGPGEREQKLHRDDMLIAMPRPFHRPVIVNTIWALSNFTAENGATVLARGSHRHDSSVPPAENFEFSTMPRGSILIYDGSVWHGAGANLTVADRRTGLILTYCAQFIRPFEQQLKLLPLDELRAMSPLLRQLSGFDYSVDIR